MLFTIKDWKKVHSDDNHTIMRNDAGHELKISHGKISRGMKKKLEKLKMAEGGEANASAEDKKKEDKPKEEEHKKGDLYRKGSPFVRKALQEGMNKAFGFADGGEAKKKELEIEEIESKGPVEVEPIKHLDYEAIEPMPKKIPKGEAAYPKKMAEGGDIPYDKLLPQEAADKAPFGVPPEAMSSEAPPAASAMPSASAPGMEPPASVDVNINGVTPDQSKQAAEMSKESQQKAMAAEPPKGDAAIATDAARKEQEIKDAMKPSAELSSVPGYDAQVKGIEMEQKALAAKGAEEAKKLQKQAEFGATMMSDYEQHTKELDNERKAFQQDIMDQHIDPNRYMGSMDTGQRIMTAIGLIMGGLGGGGRGNQAMDFLNKQIDNDIAAQKANLGKKESLLSANLRQFGNLKDATEMTRIMQHDMISAQLQKASSKASTELAKANALKMKGMLDAASAPMAQKLAMQKALSQAGQGQQFIDADPATYVSTVVPEPRQKEVFGEIERAQDTRKMGNSIIKSFDEAAKDNTVLKTGAGLLRTPASVMALHQAMQPTFKDLEGTVRQAAMDNTFKNITPQPGDAESTVLTKRKALLDYLQSKSSAPTAKGFGIDLDKFKSTSSRPEAGANVKPEDQSMIAWARQALRSDPNNSKAKMVLKKNQIE